MGLLEACAGENQSWSRAGRALGFQCTTLDYNMKIPGTDLYEDVRTFEPTEDYDVVCCSPDCREISRARSMKGDVAYADEVGKACVRLCLRAAARVERRLPAHVKGRGIFRHVGFEENCAAAREAPGGAAAAAAARAAA